jgi:hypothetical protein
MFKQLRILAVITLLFLSLSPAKATPVTWQFNDVAFSDGTSLTGRFTFDSDNNFVYDWFLHTEDGSTEKFYYTMSNSTGGIIEGNFDGQVWQEFDILFESFTNTTSRYLVLSFSPQLDNNVGLRLIDLDHKSYECNVKDDCKGPYAVSRYVTGGSASEFINLPEPGTALLLALGLAGMCAPALKRRS